MGKSKMRLCLVLCIMLTMVNGAARPLVNLKPIIGVLAQETDPKLVNYGDTYIPADYFKYLEMAGARAIPVMVKQPLEYYERIFQSINGLLFPGGGVDLLKSEYAKAAQVFYKLANQANDNGDFFPLWGTCQGFELFTALTTGRDLLSHVDCYDVALPLEFTDDIFSSRLFGNLPYDVYKYLATQNTTMNFHHYGLTPETYELNGELKSFYKVLSTNVDKQGKRFISTIEARNYPYYGIQWHPEKANFIWNQNLHINHDYAAIRVSQYTANFFVQEARKSGHYFRNETEEFYSLIENFQPVFNPDSTFGDVYYFNYTNSNLRWPVVQLN